MKEFIDAANKIFNKVDDINDIEKSYYASIGIAATSEPDDTVVK